MANYPRVPVLLSRRKEIYQYPDLQLTGLRGVGCLGQLGRDELVDGDVYDPAVDREDRPF